MTILFILMGLLFLVGVVFSVLNEINFSDKESKEEVLPYIKKDYLMTYFENSFFKALQKELGEEYYIFPQINIDKLVLITGKSFYNKGYRSKINKKSVDFVICDTEKISPLLIVELDDSSHERRDRKERDTFVDAIFNHCGITIFHAKSVSDIQDILRILKIT